MTFAYNEKYKTINSFKTVIRPKTEYKHLDELEERAFYSRLSSMASQCLEKEEYIELLKEQLNIFRQDAQRNYEKYRKKYSPLMDSDKLCVIYIKPSQKYMYWKCCEIKVSDISTIRKHQEVRFTKGGIIEKRNGVDYYIDCQVQEPIQAFSYPAGQYPIDMGSGFEIDYNKMFDLLILGPMNRIIESMGYTPLDVNISYSMSLF